MCHVVELPLHGTVPVVLDGVVRATFQDLGDLGPFVFELAVHHEQNPLFLFAPTAFLNLGIQVVVPPFTALLAYALREIL